MKWFILYDKLLDLCEPRFYKKLQSLIHNHKSHFGYEYNNNIPENIFNIIIKSPYANYFLSNIEIIKWLQTYNYKINTNDITEAVKNKKIKIMSIINIIRCSTNHPENLLTTILTSDLITTKGIFFVLDKLVECNLQIPKDLLLKISSSAKVKFYWSYEKLILSAIISGAQLPPNSLQLALTTSRPSINIIKALQSKNIFISQKVINSHLDHLCNCNSSSIVNLYQEFFFALLYLGAKFPDWIIFGKSNLLDKIVSQIIKHPSQDSVSIINNLISAGWTVSDMALLEIINEYHSNTFKDENLLEIFKFVLSKVRFKNNNIINFLLTRTFVDLEFLKQLIYHSYPINSEILLQASKQKDQGNKDNILLFLNLAIKLNTQVSKLLCICPSISNYLNTPLMRESLLMGSMNIYEVIHKQLSKQNTSKLTFNLHLNILKGPLIKHYSCNNLEDICKLIVTENVKTYFRFNGFGDICCTIEIVGDPKIYNSNISILLKYADLSMLKLGLNLIDESMIINKLGLFLNSKSINMNDCPYDIDEILYKAIRRYTNDKHYNDINSMLRGRTDLIKDTNSSILKLNFITCILAIKGLVLIEQQIDCISKQAEKIQRSVLEALLIPYVETKQISINLFNRLIVQNDSLLIEQELPVKILLKINKKLLSYKQAIIKLVQQNKLSPKLSKIILSKNKPIYRYTKGVRSKLPNQAGLMEYGFFSFSATNIAGFGTTQLTILNKTNQAHISFVSLSNNEHEVLLKPKTQYIIKKTSSKRYIAKTVVTPELQNKSLLGSELALRVVYKKYLQKTYLDRPDPFEYKGLIIARHRHGLAHTVRQLYYKHAVINYFKIHAKDDSLKLFCQQITEKELMIIDLILMFYISGRQSEVSFKQNPDLYKYYRLVSANNFILYVKTYMLSNFQHLKMTKIEISEVINILKMGSTSYANDDDSYYEYINLICNLTHKLDLWRVYDISQYEKSLSRHLSKIKTSKQQQLDLAKLAIYACRCILATGEQPYIIDNAMPFRNIINRDSYFDTTQSHSPNAERFIKCSQQPIVCDAFLTRVAPPFQQRYFNKTINSIPPGFISILKKLINTSDEIDDLLENHVDDSQKARLYEVLSTKEPDVLLYK